MGQNSEIQWCHHSANLWWGCVHAGPGCDRCYAEVLSKRWGNDVWGNNKPRKQIEGVWKDFAKYQKIAAAAGEMHRVFVGSMMDIFEKPMPLVNSKGIMATDASDGSEIDNEHLRQRFFNEVIPNSPNLLFLLLTKRPSNINKMIPDAWKENPPANVMFGTSPVDQETADKLIPQLLEVNGRKFLSIEPQLGFIDMSRWMPECYEGKNENGETVRSPKYFMCKCQCDWIGSSEYLDGGGQIGDTGDYADCYCPKCGNNADDIEFDSKISWVINGGESGHGRRPFDLEWARSLRDQCATANVPFFFKQIDKVREKSEGIPDDLQIREFPL